MKRVRNVGFSATYFGFTKDNITFVSSFMECNPIFIRPIPNTVTVMLVSPYEMVKLLLQNAHLPTFELLESPF